MSIFLSPGVVTQEQDATLYVRENSNKVGAIAGSFQWGPVNEPTLVTTGEEDFISRFHKPNNDVAKYVMPTLDFLSYSGSIYVARIVGPTAVNAVPTGETAVLIENDNEFVDANLSGIDFIAKYPGSLGNGIAIDIASNATFDAWEHKNSFTYKPRAGEFSVAVVDTSGVWTGAGAIKQVEKFTVTGTVTADVAITVAGASVDLLTGDTASVAAGKIAVDTEFAALWDEVIVVGNTVTVTHLTAGRKTKTAAVAETSGVSVATEIITNGRAGTVIEAYELLKDDPTAKSVDGTTKYWYDAINKGSRYIRAGDKEVALSARTVVLTGGVDDHDINVSEGFSLFVNKEAYDIQFLIAPAVSVAEQKAIVDLADTRGDCMAFVAPEIDDVVNNKGDELADVLEWRLDLLNKDSTYLFIVDNWGYMYDKYNDVYRWVPATGGTAGLAARTFVENDPWIPFSGFQRGRYKNYIKMAWSASEGDRNELYKVAINSIVTFPGQGIVLYGDKTGTSRPSAFDRVNVRWAFIVVKESLADMAKYFLFELNTPFTRAQFVNAGRPFLRNMRGRDAFEDFRLICDETNNTGAVRAENKMIAQVLIKPLYSINWVVLNLTSVRPDVSFEEVEISVG